MTGLLMSSTVPDTSTVASIADEAELWLQTQVQPENPVQWRPRGGEPTPVHGREQLAEMIASLGEIGAWGVVTRDNAGLWGQTMRVRDGWIVEVNGIPGPECFTRRVRVAGAAALGEATPRARSGRPGRPTETFRDGESIAPAAAADVLWSWLRGRLATGYELRDVVEGVD